MKRKKVRLHFKLKYSFQIELLPRPGLVSSAVNFESTYVISWQEGLATVVKVLVDILVASTGALSTEARHVRVLSSFVIHL